ncbi:MAG: hypothetical protein PHE79_09740 [Eubacteriales bacterium]|nr:hypothetical protein [Eubacteriales bacterium]
MTIFRGYGGVNRQIKAQHRGLSGVNRTIREQYRGYSGVNRKVFLSFDGVLYNYGDEISHVTGGWLGVTTKGTATETKNADNLYVASPPYSNDGMFVTNNLIDLTNFTKLKITYQSNDNSNGWVSLAAGDSKSVNAYPGNNLVGKVLDDSPSSMMTAELEISAITGSHYIKIGTGSGSSSPTVWVNAYKIWLE